MRSPSYKRKTLTKYVVLRVVQLEEAVQEQNQRMLEDSFPATTTMPASSRRAKDITNAIGYFVAKDMMPISTTSGCWI